MESVLSRGERVRGNDGFTSSKSMCCTWTVSMVEVGVVGDWVSPRVSNPDVFAKIAVFESFKRSDVGLNGPSGGDVE